VARRADLTLLVVREGQTSRNAAILARRRLESMQVKVAGAVMNCASPQGSGYYYSAYYGKS
jgi:dethiobiotin synthetase